MADFRKWFLASAAVAVLATLAVPASAQNINPAFQCVANAGVPPTVRAEGLTELVGDLTLNCSGGTPTPAGQAVPQVNVAIFLNTNATSRLLSTNQPSGQQFNEALLIIDEPHSATLPNRNILNCGHDAGVNDNGPSGPGVCSIIATNNPANTYQGVSGVAWTGGAGGADAACSGFGCGRPNVFQGRQAVGQVNSVVFLGVPLDPPGTTTNRVIRITNVRANANQQGLPSTLTSVSQIVMNISVSGNTSLSINNPQQIVAYILPGLVSSVRSPVTFVQCNDANRSLFLGSGGLASGGQNGQQFSLRFQEGFASSWKEKNIVEHITNGTFASGQYAFNGGVNYPADLNQNVPGAIYNTESGLMYPPSISDPSPNNPPNGYGTVFVTSTATSFASPSGTGISNAGVATQGTRLVISFASIPNGSDVYVPNIVSLVRQNATTTVSGVMVLVNTDATGSGGSPAGAAAGVTKVGQFANAGLAVYEVLFADPFSLEQADVPIAVAFASNPGNNLPAPLVQSTATAGFAPFSSNASWGLASFSLPHPRFVPGTPARNTFIVVKCSCNILFPFVTNQQGYDTGIAIANTTVDPFGTTPQTGTVLLNYYGSGPGGSAAPAAQTSQPVPGGAQLLFTLSGGGNFGVDNRAAGFQGYIIAQSQFQFCHALAYLTALGASASTASQSEAYLGIVLDQASLERTGQLGENKAH
ncbi:MAG: hypothetical protein ABI823_01720 [Bryobacteraceae bacterium]